MNDLLIARALHVLGVVLWIGGVAMVTTVLLPAVKAFKSPAERVAFFEAVESRFASQARYTTVLVGATGFYMVHMLGLWERFLSPAYWWMHGMVFVWLVFTLMLFVLEPLFLHRWFQARAQRDPMGTFRLVHGLHVFLLSISLITLMGAVAGAHGWLP